MSPRVAAADTASKTSRSRSRPLTASSSASSSRTKTTMSRPPRARSHKGSNIGDESGEEMDAADSRDRDSGRANSSITGPIFMDDDEEDELGLRSPVKIGNTAAEREGNIKIKKTGSSTSSALSSSSPSFAPSKVKTVFGNARGVNSQDNSRDHDLVDPIRDYGDNDASSKPSSTRPTKGRGVRAAPKKPKALKSRVKLRKAHLGVESGDEEVDVGDEERGEVEGQSNAIPRSADGVSMPEEQIQHFLHGYDLDAANRIDRLHNHLTVTLESARSQMSILLSRLPMAARSLPLRQFLELHDADVRRVVKGAEALPAGKVDDDDADGWEEMKKKRLRGRDVDGDEADKGKTRRGKAARRNGTVSSPAKPALLALQSSSKAPDKKAIPLTGRPVASSGPPAPSSASFSPRLNSTMRNMPINSNVAATATTAAALAKTPARSAAVAGRASRLAKIGEQIQMYSLNGSPITGFIGPDGRLRYLPRGGPSVNADEVEEEMEDHKDVENAGPVAPPHTKALERKTSATSIKDAHHRANSTANALASILPKAGDTSSSRLPPSSPAPQRQSAFSSSLGRGTGLTSRIDNSSSSSAVPSSPLRPMSRDGGGQRRDQLTSSLFGKGLEALTMMDDSNELPDEEAYMQEIMAQEEKKRRDREAVMRSMGSSTAAAPTTTLQHKSSASRLMAKFGGGGGGSSSNPPSSPAPASSSLSSRSAGFRSSSPSKAPQLARGIGPGASLLNKAASAASLRSTNGKKTAVATMGTTDVHLDGASGAPGTMTTTNGVGHKGTANKQRLSLINARGEVVPIEDIREEDVPVEQKAQLARMFQRLGMGFGLGVGGGGGGSPKKK